MKTKFIIGLLLISIILSGCAQQPKTGEKPTTLTKTEQQAIAKDTTAATIEAKNLETEMGDIDKTLQELDTLESEDLTIDEDTFK